MTERERKKSREWPKVSVEIHNLTECLRAAHSNTDFNPLLSGPTWISVCCGCFPTHTHINACSQPTTSFLIVSRVLPPPQHISVKTLLFCKRSARCLSYSSHRVFIAHSVRQYSAFVRIHLEIITLTTAWEMEGLKEGEGLILNMYPLTSCIVLQAMCMIASSLCECVCVCLCVLGYVFVLIGSWKILTVFSFSSLISMCNSPVSFPSCLLLSLLPALPLFSFPTCSTPQKHLTLSHFVTLKHLFYSLGVWVIC